MYRTILEKAMESDSVKAYIVQQVKLPAKRAISMCVRKLVVFCVGKFTRLTKELYFAT